MPPSSRSIDGETLPVGVIGLTCTKVEGCFNWNKALERPWAWSHSQTLPESGSGVLSDTLVTWGRAYHVKVLRIKILCWSFLMDHFTWSTAQYGLQKLEKTVKSPGQARTSCEAI